MNPVLAVNCGSSSLKYAVFADDQALHRGAVGRIGSGGPSDHAAAVLAMFDELTHLRLPAPVAGDRAPLARSQGVANRW